MPNSPEGYTFLIIISILLTTYLGYKFHQNRHSIFKYGKRLGFIVIGFWILYTILNVRSQSLENHQLIVIIVTGVIAYIFVRSFFNKDKEIKELKRNLKSYDSKILNENIDIVKRVEILKTPISHRKKLLETIDQSQSTLIIISGWARENAMNDEFRNRIKNALNRGVNIFLGYGYKGFSEEENEKHRVASKKVINDLQEWSSNIVSIGLLRSRYYPEHSKILICDDQFAIYGSFNWLSNKGEFSKNNETSCIVFDKEIIKKEMNLIIRQYEDLQTEQSRREFFRKLYPNLYPLD